MTGLIAESFERIRLFWACITVGAIYLSLMLSFHFLSVFVGRQRAYHRVLWRLEHLTERFSKTGRHRRAEGEESMGACEKKVGHA